MPADRRHRNDVADVALLCDELSTDPTAGGIASYTLDLARSLKAAGSKVLVVGIDPAASRSRVTEIDGIGAVLGPGRFAWTVTRPLRRLPRSRQRIASTIALIRALRTLGRRAKVVEATDWMATGLAMPRRSIRVVQRHGALVEMLASAGEGPTLDARIASWLEQRGVERAQLVTRWPSRPGLGDPDEPITLPPLDLRLWPKADWKEAIPGRLLSVGRLERRKGPGVLVSAASLLENTSVEWVGVNNSTDASGMREHLLEVARRAQRELLLTPTTPRVQLHRAYARAEIVVVSSLQETLSLVALEACASGRPVVLPDGSGAGVLLEGLPAMRSFSPGDPVSLARAITDLRQSADLESLGDVAASWVRENLSPEKVAEARLVIYAEAARRRADTNARFTAS